MTDDRDRPVWFTASMDERVCLVVHTDGGIVWRSDASEAEVAWGRSVMRRRGITDEEIERGRVDAERLPKGHVKAGEA